MSEWQEITEYYNTDDYDEILDKIHTTEIKYQRETLEDAGFDTTDWDDYTVQQAFEAFCDA